jgi:multiple sugar transport system ATP-binding protein
MSVFDNMAFGLKLRKMDKVEIKRRVDKAADILNIQELLDRKPRQLSGGQRQRVAVGRAIVREPNVFLLDEPLSNLDAKLRVAMRAEISKLHKQLETTFIYVTHDQVEAMTMATRIAVMNAGLLQQIDTPQNLYDFPANKFVAGFIGSPSMNFFPGKLVQEGGGLAFDAGSFTIGIPSGKAGPYGGFAGKDVVLGIRPEDVHDPSFLPGGIVESKLKAKVDVIEMMGNETFTYFSSGAHEFIGRIDPRSTFRYGDDVEVSFNMDNMHLFNSETEEAIR